MMPYSGTWEQTKKMRSVTAVHRIFWLKGTLRSGDETSGRIGRNGRTRLRKRTTRNSELNVPDDEDDNNERNTHSRSW